jgi:hypothetical protein
MNRREFLRSSTWAAAAPYIASPKGRQLNVLFIMSDQHQRAASGCYGSLEAKTPHIDRIAATRAIDGLLNTPTPCRTRSGWTLVLSPERTFFLLHVF